MKIHSLGAFTVLLLSFIARPVSAGLKDLNSRVKMGAAIAAYNLKNDPNYTAVAAREYNFSTSENAMKFERIHPQQGVYDFSGGDDLAAFAAQNGTKVRGHTLDWHLQVPSWVTDGNFTGAQLQEILRDHIVTVMSHYRDKYPGTVQIWDVVNEAVDVKSGSIWAKIGSTWQDHIFFAFQVARATDPNAKLYYNDYGAETQNSKSDEVYNLVSQLKAQGLIDGVGFQAHFVSSVPSQSALQANLARFAALGLDVQFTELDVGIYDQGSATVTNDQLNTQAAGYAAVAAACVAVPRCTGITTWGITDAFSWIPAYYPNYGHALPFDKALQPKPAYYALADSLARPTVPVTFGAQTMAWSDNSTVKTSDGGAALMSPGSVSRVARFLTSGSMNFDLVLRGDSAGGAAPIAELRIDGISVGQVSVSATSWTSYRLTANVSSGDHKVEVAFTNDYWNSSTGADRNLYVNSVTITPAAASTSIVLDAAAMPYRTGLYTLTVTGGVGIYAPGSIGQDVNFPLSATYAGTLSAWGSIAGGSGPIAEIRIDGSTQASISVDSTTLQDYPFSINVGSGTHRLEVVFVNDYRDTTTGQDRNLFVQKITLATGGSTPTPTPTPSPTPTSTPTSTPSGLRLSFLGLPAQGINIGTCIGNLKVVRLDSTGATSHESVDLNVAISSTNSGRFYSDSGCTNAISSTFIPSGWAGSQNAFYFKGSAAGTDSLLARLSGYSDGTGVISLTDPTTPAPTGPKLVFYNLPSQSVQAGTCIGNLKVVRLDSTGATSHEAVDLNVAVSSSNSGRFYSDSACTNVISSSLIPSGWAGSQNTFYFKGDVTGSDSLLGRASGYLDGTGVISISP